MKVYLLIDDSGSELNCDVIKGIFLKKIDAEKMLDSFGIKQNKGYRIDEHNVIE